MSAETKPTETLTPTIEQEKLGLLWETACHLLEKSADHTTYDRRLVLIDSTLVEIQSHWDDDSLSGIDIRSWDTIHGPLNPYSILEKNAEFRVKNPGSLGTRDGRFKESFEIEGDVSDEWVENIQGGLDFLLKH
jgi:hypothetical protein